MVFQNPYGSLNPRKKIGAILEAPLVDQHRARRVRAHRARARDAREGRLAARALRSLPAHVLGRPAPAHRDRARADARARARRRRRARVRARRVGAGAGAEPDGRPAARPGGRVSLHLARSRGGPLHRARRARDVPRPRDGAGARRSASSRGRCIRTRRRCWRRPRRSAACASSASCSTGELPSPLESAAGVRLLHPLPARDRPLPAASARRCVRSTAGWSPATLRKIFSNPVILIAGFACVDRTDSGGIS